MYNKGFYSRASDPHSHVRFTTFNMEKRIASLLNSSKSGNIFDLEGDGVRELIQDYFASNSACEGNDFDRDSEEETDCKQEPELDCKDSKETPVPDTEVEVEQPIIRIEGNADVDIECNGQGLRELQVLEQFSCNCAMIECVTEPGDQRSGCIVQFSPAEVLAYSLSCKDMERGT